jgi:hypothetical protein
MHEGSIPFSFQEMLRNVEIALCCCIRCLVPRVLADYNQFGVGVAIESEGDLVEVQRADPELQERTG